MPVLHFIKHVVQVPDSWEGWAMRVLTIGIILVLGAAFVLGQQVSLLRDQVTNGRAERNAYQVEQTARVCTLFRASGVPEDELKAAKC
jgi:hypothetical protein